MKTVQTDSGQIKIEDILKALALMPISEKLYIIEAISKDIQAQTIKIEKEENTRKKAAQLLLADYQNDEELTAFTLLDKESFYETK